MYLLRDFTPDKAHLIVKRIQERMGAVKVLMEQMDEIPRERNGKFRSVICRIPDEQKNYLRRRRRSVACDDLPPIPCTDREYDKQTTR